MSSISLLPAAGIGSRETTGSSFVHFNADAVPYVPRSVAKSAAMPEGQRLPHRHPRGDHSVLQRATLPETSTAGSAKSTTTACVPQGTKVQVASTSKMGETPRIRFSRDTLLCVLAANLGNYVWLPSAHFTTTQQGGGGGRGGGGGGRAAHRHHETRQAGNAAADGHFTTAGGADCEAVVQSEKVIVSLIRSEIADGRFVALLREPLPSYTFDAGSIVELPRAPPSRYAPQSAALPTVTATSVPTTTLVRPWRGTCDSAAPPPHGGALKLIAVRCVTHMEAPSVTLGAVGSNVCGKPVRASIKGPSKPVRPAAAATSTQSEVDPTEVERCWADVVSSAITLDQRNPYTSLWSKLGTAGTSRTEIDRGASQPPPPPPVDGGSSSNSGSWVLNADGTVAGQIKPFAVVARSGAMPAPTAMSLPQRRNPAAAVSRSCAAAPAENEDAGCRGGGAAAVPTTVELVSTPGDPLVDAAIGSYVRRVLSSSGSSVADRGTPAVTSPSVNGSPLPASSTAFLSQSGDAIYPLLQVEMILRGPRSSRRMRKLLSVAPRAVQLIQEYLLGVDGVRVCVPPPPATEHPTWETYGRLLGFHRIRDNVTCIYTELSPQWRKRTTPFEQFLHFYAFRRDTPRHPTKAMLTHAEKPTLVAALAGDPAAFVRLAQLGFRVFPDRYFDVFASEFSTAMSTSRWELMRQLQRRFLHHDESVTVPRK